MKSDKNNSATLKIIILISLFAVFSIFVVLFSGRAFEYKTLMYEAFEPYILSPDETVTQKIFHQGDRIDGVSAAFTTFGRVNTGHVTAALFEDGIMVRSAGIEASYIQDNAYHDFRFESSYKTKPGHDYDIRITYDHDDSGNTLALWTSYSGDHLTASGSVIGGRTLCYQLMLINGIMRMVSVIIFLLIAMAGLVFYVKTSDAGKISIPKALAVAVISVLVMEILSADLLGKTELNVTMPVKAGISTEETVYPGYSLSVPFSVSYSPVNRLGFALGAGDYDNIDLCLINTDTSAVYADRHIEADEILQDHSNGLPSVSISASSCGIKKFPLGNYEVRITNTSPDRLLSVMMTEYDDGRRGICNTQSDFSWMTRITACVVFLVLAVYLYLVFIFTRKAPVRPEKMFLCTVIPLGAVYFALFQPWSAPDTMAHFQAVYRISNTVMGYNANNGWMIRPSDNAFYENVWRTASSYPSSGSLAGMLNNLGTGSSGNNMIIFEDPMDQMEYYTIISYLPMVIGFVIGRLFNLGTAWVLTIGRLLMFVFYIVICYRAIKISPVGKSIFTAVCLLPMSLMMGSSISYDAMVIVTTVAFTAGVLRLREKGDLPGIIEACVWSFFIGGVKGGGYLYLIALLIVLWKKNERDTSIKKIFAVAAAGIFAAVFFNMLVPKVKLFQFGTEGSYKLTTKWGLTHPVEYINMCAAAFIDYADNLFINIGGTILAWNEFTIQNVVVAVLMVTALFASVFEKDDTELSRKDKAVFILVCLISFCCTPLMLLSWTDANSVRVEGLQGRYFLPVLPLIMMILTKFSIHKAVPDPDGKNGSAVMVKCQRLFAVISVLCVYYMLRLYLTR